MPIFDTHAHYQDEAFDMDRQELLNGLATKNVQNVLNAATSLTSIREVLALSEKYPFCYAAVGIHPSDILQVYETLGHKDDNVILNEVKKAASHPKNIAIGEIGLEYHYDFVPKELQLFYFRKQLELANELDLPVIVHDREAHEDTINLLKDFKPKGVVHCFSGSVEMMKEVLKLGMYIGLGGAVTFKNAKKPLEVAAAVPMEKLLLETDAPYMAPVPFRGNRCDSSMIEQTASVIASVKGCSVEELIEQCTQNTFCAFPKLNLFK